MTRPLRPIVGTARPAYVLVVKITPENLSTLETWAGRTDLLGPETIGNYYVRRDDTTTPEILTLGELAGRYDPVGPHSWDDDEATR